MKVNVKKILIKTLAGALAGTLVFSTGMIITWANNHTEAAKTMNLDEKSEDDKKDLNESIDQSANESNEQSTVGMNEAYIAEKIFEGSDRSDWRWQIKATDCHISRELDFDLSVIETQRGLHDEHKQCMDSNKNFLKDYYYVTIELDVTNMSEKEYFNPYYWIFYMDDELGRMVMQEPYGKIYADKDMSDEHLLLSIDKGETTHIILYYILEDKYTQDSMYMSMYKQSNQLEEPTILLKETR